MALGGRGTHIIRSIMDKVCYERVARGNLLRLRKRLPLGDSRRRKSREERMNTATRNSRGTMIVPIMYYGIQVPATPAPSHFTYPIEIVVGRITGPDLRIQAKLIRLFRTSGEYRAVSDPGGSSVGDLVVRGRLYEFTEVDGEAITGLVSMEFELYNRKSNSTVWTHFYSQTEAVEGKQISAVVQALDRNFDRGLKKVVARLGQYFVANPPVKREAYSQRALKEAKAK